jgi:hypothetical protein
MHGKTTIKINDKWLCIIDLQFVVSSIVFANIPCIFQAYAI